MNWETLKELLMILFLIRCCRVSIASSDSDEDLTQQGGGGDISP